MSDREFENMLEVLEKMDLAGLAGIERGTPEEESFLLEAAEGWLDYEFTPKETLQWIRSGVHQPVTAVILRNRDIHPAILRSRRWNGMPLAYAYESGNITLEELEEICSL